VFSIMVLLLEKDKRLSSYVVIVMPVTIEG